MKTEIIKQTAFQPVTVKLTFESQAELDILTLLFNHTVFCDFKLNGIKVNDIISETLFAEAGGNLEQSVAPLTEYLKRRFERGA